VSVPYGTASTLAATGLHAGATGTVTFSSGATLCTATLPATTCSTALTLAAGSYPITATYSGDAAMPVQPRPRHSLSRLRRRRSR